jgi:hypothetical protein
MYRLLFDPTLTSQWFIETPVDDLGDEWAFWRLLSGSPLEGTDVLPWQSKVKQEGQRLSFSFAGFDVPVVTSEVATALMALVGDHVQFPQLLIAGESLTYRILVATRAVPCVDESKSEFVKWGASDGRPEKCGEYRMFTRLRLDPALIPPDASIFRVLGWSQALIVTERVAIALRSCVPSGLVYEPVV